MIMPDRKAAFKEAFSDTMFALIINFPLNLIMVYIAVYWKFTPFQTSLFLTVVFTTIAIIRKYYTRLYFENKNIKKSIKKG